MAPPFAQKTGSVSPQSTRSSGPPGLTSSRRAGPPTPPGKSGTEILKDLDREITRKTFFDNRPDISDDRLDRRLQQDKEERDFISTLRTAGGSPTNLLQEEAPVFNPMTGKYERTTLAQKRQQIANKYGPTFNEIMSDVTYAGGKTLGALGERALSGGLGFLGAMNEVVKYATSKARDGYNKLNDVQKEIADNKDKYSRTYNGLPAIYSMNNNERLALEAQRDLQKSTFAGDASGVLSVDTNRLDGFVNEPIDTFGTAGPTVDLRKPTIEELRTMPVTQTRVFPAEEVKEAAMDRFSPEYLAEQQRQLEELNRLRQVEELKPNAPGGTLEDMSIEAQPGEGNFMFPESYTIPFTDIEVPSLMRKIEGGITGGKGLLTGDDQASVTQYDNPVNLKDVGQEGTTGETYGDGFAVFENANAGIMAAKKDLALKTDRFDGDVEKIIGQFSPRVDNPDSFDNYVNFVKQGVGNRVDPGEEDELLRRVIRFENKPDIAERYLALVADGGLMDKKMYGGIIASKG